jgi:hypothetical protein
MTDMLLLFKNSDITKFIMYQNQTFFRLFHIFLQFIYISLQIFLLKYHKIPYTLALVLAVRTDVPFLILRKL